MITAYLGDKKLYAENCVDRVDYHDGFSNIMRLVKPTEKIIDHFRYKVRKDSIDYEPESNEHIFGKKFLKEFFIKQYPQTDDEVRFLDIRRIADVYIPEQKVCLEYQCSTIQQQKMIDREESYKQKNIKVLWIFGIKNFLTGYGYTKRRLRSIERFINDKYGKVYYISRNKLFCVTFYDDGYETILGISSVKHITNIDFETKKYKEIEIYPYSFFRFIGWKSDKLTKKPDQHQTQNIKDFVVDENGYLDDYYIYDRNKKSDYEENNYWINKVKQEEEFQKIKKYLHPKTEIDEWL